MPVGLSAQHFNIMLNQWPCSAVEFEFTNHKQPWELNPRRLELRALLKMLQSHFGSSRHVFIRSETGRASTLHLTEISNAKMFYASPSADVPLCSNKYGPMWKRVADSDKAQLKSPTTLVLETHVLCLNSSSYWVFAIRIVLSYEHIIYF
ncbi:hypothetical protein CEXT_537481 [Caerostris extrusa]|uniref:Uncharacterized protein n=1 Tax=Caerostris extrusa TaxID=172846 RepID=A0AAV4QG08_CAEEX|nr:hypothetical protein CEXT_537481 [Caerostris extrusa]